jgi:PAS domain S-box-containing protein
MADRYPRDPGDAKTTGTAADPDTARAIDPQLGHRLAALVERLSEAVLCCDRNWCITYANAAARSISRITDADLNHKSHWELFPETLGTEVERTYRRVLESQTPGQLEHYYAPFDIWVSVRVLPTDEGVALYYQDITANKRAEKHRANISSQLEQVFEITTDGIVVLDREWNLTYLNRRGRELLAPMTDLVGKNLWEQFPAAVGQTAYEYHYRRTMEQGIPSEFEEFYPEPLNSWLWIQARPSDDGIVIFFRDVTERRAREQKLLEQQRALAQVQQTALAATWEFDLATQRLSFGVGSYPIFGRPLEEVATIDAMQAIIATGDWAVARQAAQDAVAGRALVVVEFSVLGADGNVIWLESRGQAVYAEAGPQTMPKHIRGLTLDVTGRKRNEAALVASEARYRVLADLNPQAIWMGAADGRITYANQGFLDYIGLTMETIGGLGWLNAFYVEERQTVLDTWIRSVQTGVDYEVESRMVRARDGAVRWWVLRAQPVRDESGAILHWLGIGTDIHDGKLAAEALQQKQLETERQRTELETVYQTAPVGLALFDPVELRYLRLNERQAEILGMAPDQVVGSTLEEVAPVPGLRELFQRTLAGETVRNHVVEGELPTRPGEHRIWNVSHSPVYDADGAIQAITVSWLEITHLKKAEAALIQSEKLAAVGRLASSISHEINNPLEAITNLLYLIAMSDGLPAELKVYVHMAQSELSRVSQIATQTLRFHRQAVRPTEVSPADLIGAVLNLYQGRLANSGIKVHAAYSTSRRVLCFENDIRQVLNNLIANAIDAMRSGGHLSVRAHEATQHSTGRRGVRLSIADTGHGMPPAVLVRLFEPFYTTKDLNGTGLGLWISEGIVQRHRGRLSVRSSQHPTRHGTVFTLFLPFETPTIATHPSS